MSKRLPAVKPKEGVPDLVIIPLHTGDLPKGTLHAILEDAGLNIEQFLELL